METIHHHHNVFVSRVCLWVAPHMCIVIFNRNRLLVLYCCIDPFLVSSGPFFDIFPTIHPIKFFPDFCQGLFCPQVPCQRDVPPCSCHNTSGSLFFGITKCVFVLVLLFKRPYWNFNELHWVQYAFPVGPCRAISSHTSLRSSALHSNIKSKSISLFWFLWISVCF